jgi:hypothetical protein
MRQQIPIVPQRLTGWSFLTQQRRRLCQRRPASSEGSLNRNRGLLMDSPAGVSHGR